MKTMSSIVDHSLANKPTPLMGGFLYKTIAIYPNFANVGSNLALLNNAGFTNDQISVLGREQEHWRETLVQEWDALKAAKGALGGAALGSIPGLVIITGMALTGGIGLLAAGPMVVALSSLGLGALSGGLMGGGYSALDTNEKIMNVGEEVEDAISHGKWVVIAHSYDEAEAKHAQKLLQGSHTVHENESK
jgi:hypothetical protein